GDAKAAADWVLNQPTALMAVAPDRLAALIGLIAAGTITSTIAKQVYERLEHDPDADPVAVVEREGLASIGGDEQLGEIVDEVISGNSGLVEQYRSGKQGVANALVGQVMRQTSGRADARRVQELLRERLDGG
ncbi:MAG TPA: hypothetical protein VMU66_06075, partial [Gaiellales bacterium]|nr:hypothetical protein [Gaiellales bacterium]